MDWIYKNRPVFTILFLAFCKPIFLQYYSRLQWLDTAYDLYKIAAVLVIFSACAVTSDLVVEIYRPYSSVLFFALWQFLVTVYFRGAVFRSIIDGVSVFAMFYFITSAMKLNGRETVRTVKTILLFLLAFQLISEIFYSGGLPADLYYQNNSNRLFFLTLDNGTSLLTTICTGLCYIDRELNDHDTWYWFYLELILCLGTAAGSGSTTAVLCTIAMTAIPVLFRMLPDRKVFYHIEFWIGAYLLLFFLLVLGGTESVLSSAAEILTGKNGFTGRTFLWNRAWELIRLSPWIGYGRQNAGYLSVWGSSFSSHNVLLEAMLGGGIIEAALWLNCFVQSGWNLRNRESELSKIINAIIFISLLSLLMEVSIFSIYLFMILAIAYGMQFVESENSIGEKQYE